MIETGLANYHQLNPKTELEQILTAELTRALQKRGFEVKHNGTTTTNAPGGVPDIEVWDNHYHINVEATKTTKSILGRRNLRKRFIPLKLTRNSLTL